MECTDFDPEKRPNSMKHIMDRHHQNEGAPEITTCVPIKLLGAQPFALCFAFEPNRSITSSLQLTNNSDEPMAFRLMQRRESLDCFLRLPQYGVVLPRSPYTLVVTTKKVKELPQLRNIDLILESTRLGDEQILIFQSKQDYFFEEAKQMTNMVQAITLKALYTRREMATSAKIISMDPLYKRMYSLDVNMAKKWIITGEGHGHVRIWNCQTQTKVDSLKVSMGAVKSLTFVARKQWLIAATNKGCIHVYNCETKVQMTTSFKAENLCYDGMSVSLAAHPIRPYLLSAYDSVMKLWDWDKDWECIQKFQSVLNDHICQLAFNTHDTIASACTNHIVKVFILDSPEPKYTLSGHSGKVNCLEFFACDDQEYMVTGSDDQTAKIWDMQNRKCVDTLKAFVSPVISVLYQPNLRILITGSKDGCIYFWNKTSSRICPHSLRLDRIINIGCGGSAHSLKCLPGRVAIGKEDVVAIVDIDNGNNYLEESGHHSDPSLIQYHETRAGGNNTYEVRKLPNDHHPLELWFTRELNKSIPCSLQLANNTNQNMAFRVIDKGGKPMVHFKYQQLCGIVPPRSTYTLIMKKEQASLGLVMQSSTSGDKYKMLFKDQSECDKFFCEAKEMGKFVQEVALKTIYSSHQVGLMTSAIISTEDISISTSIDAHPTEPWIITGHRDGRVSLWNYNSKSIDPRQIRASSAGASTSWMQTVFHPKSSTQELMDSLKISEQPVSSIKFIARKQRIVAGADDGIIYVYKCVSGTNMQKITSFYSAFRYIIPLAIHPIQPYLLSSGKLWDWNKGWKCTQTFATSSVILQVVFNQEDTNNFAIALQDGTIEVWSLDSPVLNYTLSGHLDQVNCLDFFRRDNMQYLITGSNDCTAKIWDLQKKACIHTVKPIMSPVIFVISLPGRPYLVTGSRHRTVQVWSSTDFRLVRTVNLQGGGPVRGLVCLMGSRRVAIGQSNSLSIMEIDDEEAVASEGSA